VAWAQQDGRPVLVTLIDHGSGDAVSLAVIDSMEDDEPHALLAVTARSGLTAHGPIPGGAATSAYAPPAGRGRPDDHRNRPRAAAPPQPDPAT
jgi:hypothetical protein